MDALHEEVVGLARDLIRLDTTNAPGNETLVARHLADYLDEAGIECELVAREEHRANLVARLPGTGDAPSLAFVGHTDVVPVDAAGLDPSAVRGRRRRRGLPVRPRRARHEGRGRRPGGGAQGAGPLRVGGRAATCGSWPSPTRRTGWPTSACGGCSSTGPTSGPT